MPWVCVGVPCVEMPCGEEALGGEDALGGGCPGWGRCPGCGGCPGWGILVDVVLGGGALGKEWPSGWLWEGVALGGGCIGKRMSP